MNSVGNKLRQERLRQGLDLEDIAERIKISARHLQAIEADKLGSLPGRFFARSFLRQYAQFLGVEEAELAPQLQAVAAPPHPVVVEEPEASRHTISVPPLGSGHGPSGGGGRRVIPAVAAFVLMVLACSVIYVMWENTRDPEPARAGGPASVPEPSVTAGSQSTQPLSQQASNAVHTSEPASGDTGVQVEVAPVERAWIRASSDGRIIFDGILDPADGKTRTFDASKTLRLSTGNARGLNVHFRGQSLGSLGGRGQSVTLEFTPGEYRLTGVQSASNVQAPPPVGAKAVPAAAPKPPEKSNASNTRPHWRSIPDIY